MNNTATKINKITIWLDVLVGLMICAALLMIVGGAFFAGTYSSGPMSEAQRATNNLGVSIFLLGLMIFAVLTIISIILTVIRVRTINKARAANALVPHKEVTKFWVIIPILVVGLPLWSLLFAYLIH